MSYRFPATVAALVLAVLLAGCHTAKVLIPPNLRPPSENTGDALKVAQQQLLQATPCCSSFADFSYRNMLPWQPEKFTLGSGSMVANLNGTHSYFLAFRLPADVKLPYQVAMKSELNGRWLHASYLFAPTVVLLDEGFQPIRSADIGLCEHMGWSDETTGAFGSVNVDEPQARYLLIYSSADQQSGKTYWEQSPASVPTTTATLKMNPTGSFSIPHGPDGSLWVGMMHKTYKRTIDNAICKKAEKGDGVLNTLRTALPLPWINNSSNSNNSGSKSNRPSSP
jgi:maltose operon periplasmic protein